MFRTTVLQVRFRESMYTNLNIRYSDLRFKQKELGASLCQVYAFFFVGVEQRERFCDARRSQCVLSRA